MPLRVFSRLTAIAAPIFSATILLASAPGPAAAAIVVATPGDARSVSGTFIADDDVRLYDLILAGELRLSFSIETFSYAGGILRDGTMVARGGFDPILALFDASGALIARGADDPAKPDLAGERNAYDDILRIALDPGQYILSISQHRNHPPAMLDFLAPGYGFAEAGWSDYTMWDCALANTAPFCDAGGAQRSGAYAIQVAAVPLPGTLALLIGGLCAGAALRRARRAG